MKEAKTILPNAIRIDSFKIRIPLDEIQLVDNSLLDRFSEHNDSTGELTPIAKRAVNEYYFSDSSKIKAFIENVKVSKHRHVECLILLVSSKALEHDYFNGISALNIDTLHKKINNLKIFSPISFNDFLDLDCTDIDIKFDQVMTLKEWDNLLNDFKKNAKGSKRANIGYRDFRATKEKPLQRGLQFSTRRQATLSKPYFKLYYKGGELLSESLEFYEEHLSNLISQDELLSIFRIEATIKNSEQAKRLGVESCMLGNLLSISEDQLKRVMNNIISKHINEPKPIQINQKLTPDKIVKLTIMKEFLKQGKDSESIIELLVSGIERPSSKSKMRKQLRELYNEYLSQYDFSSGNLTDRLLQLRA